jgi:hypothetical protein
MITLNFNINMKWYIILVTLFLGLGSVVAQAPFEGGSGSGGNSLSLAGVDTCIHFFGGGNGSGGNSFSLAGVDTCIHFFGGNTGSGANSEIYTNPYACDVYLGDSLSGYNGNDELSSTQNCIFYTGQDASGYSDGTYDNPNACPAFFASANGDDGYAARSYTEDAGVCYVVTLPIEASPLFASIENNAGKLKWSTYAEINNAGFEIQKSFNGIDWNAIGWVDGAGSYVGTLDYEFIDEQLQYQNQYYRFKQVDFDQSYTYSNVVNLHPSMTTQDPNHIAIYPNPVRSGAYLNIRSWISYELELNAQLYNTLGQLMLQKNIAFDDFNNLIELPMNGIPQGNYFLILSNKEGVILSKSKIVVQK